MDRRILARRVAPAVLAAGPTGSDNRAGRQIDQSAMTRLRADVTDLQRIDAGRKVPRGDGIGNLRQRERIGPGFDRRGDDCGVLNFSGEMPPRCGAVFRRDQDRATFGQRGVRCRGRDDRQTPLEWKLSDKNVSAHGIRACPNPVPGPGAQRGSAGNARRAARPCQRQRDAMRSDGKGGARIVAFVRDDDLVASGQSGPDQRRPAARISGVSRWRGFHVRVRTNRDWLRAPVERAIEQWREILIAPAGTIRMRIGADDASELRTIGRSRRDADMRGDALTRPSRQSVEIASDRQFCGKRTHNVIPSSAAVPGKSRGRRRE